MENKAKDINRFIDNLFGDKLSIRIENFEKRCEAFKKDPLDVSEFLVKNGCVRFINHNTHIEFLKYLKDADL